MGAYNMYQGMSGASDQSGYDIQGLKTMQQPFMDQYNDIYGQGQEQYGQGQDYMDIGGEQNQLLRSGLMKNLMNSDAIKSMMNNRNPYTSSGIKQAQNQESRQDMMGMANDQFMQGYQQNRQFGSGLMSQGLNTQMGATQGGVGLTENIQQAMLSNTDIQNANKMTGAQNQMDFGSSLLSMAGSYLG